MVPNNRLWLLFSRHLSGEASPSEIEELQELLEQFPDKSQLLDILQSYFSASDSQPGADSSDPDFEQRFHRIIQRPAYKAPRSRLRRITSIAAALGGLIVLAWGIFHQHHAAPLNAVHNPSKGGEVAARPGVRTKVVLPDGTQVWLNSNSKLKYAPDFNLHSREVDLEGEAYFDVAKDMERPFIVHASTVDIRVLGTAFTIKSYPQDETIEATLLKGAIEISGRDNPDAPRVILKPDEKLVLNKRWLSSSLTAPAKSAGNVGVPRVRPAISVNPVPANIPDSNKVETAWLYNRLVFNGDTFRELAEKMERWYNVKIVFRDERLYKYRFGGAFANETVQDALNALQLTAPFNYKINGDDIELFYKK
jgi:transmembrane sensor